MSAQGPNFDPHQPSYDILPPTDERLYRPSDPVPPELITSPEIQEIIDTMFAISKGERPTNLVQAYMVGLAAIQLGIPKRIIIVDTVFVPGQDRAEEGDISPLQAFINPEIVAVSEESEDYYEGCYSLGDAPVMGVVPRPRWVEVRAYDRLGEQNTQKYYGFTARIFKHEIDHLNGFLFPQRMRPGKKLDVVTDETIAAYGRGGAWQHDWPTKTTFDEVLQSSTT